MMEVDVVVDVVISIVVIVVVCMYLFCYFCYKYDNYFDKEQNFYFYFPLC